MKIQHDWNKNVNIIKNSNYLVLRRDRILEDKFHMGGKDYADGYYDPQWFYYDNLNYEDSGNHYMSTYTKQNGPFHILNTYTKYVTGISNSKVNYD